MSASHRWLRAALLALSAATSLVAREFSVMVYNVENLVDADGQALYEDYKVSSKPDSYSPRKFLTKLQNIRRVLAHYNDGAGPEVIAFQEIELDMTPDSKIENFDVFLRKNESRTVEELLSAEVPDDAKGWSSEAWLLKTLEEGGLRGYHVAVARHRVDPSGRGIAHKNVVFSKFPITSTKTHFTVGARAILEVTVKVDGSELTILDNHWKSGASDAESEPIRIGNAETLRKRLDEILAADPSADVLLVGDFNSQYNQSEAYKNMPRTGVNSVLRSQGDEKAFASATGPDLYNFWYELPADQRGSDIFRNEWGTLIQMIATRGLYDFRGVQYVDNSFSVCRLPGLNSDPVQGTPIRWSNEGAVGSGFSDHFPVLAKFRTVSDNNKDRYLPITAESKPARSAKRSVAASADLGKAPKAAEYPADKVLADAANKGLIFEVEGKVVGERPFTIEVHGEKFQVWSHDREHRIEIYRAHSVGSQIHFYGRLSQYKGDWQFVIEDRSWMR